MIKNRLDYKLINTAIIVLIISLMYQAGGLWGLVVMRVFHALFPFLIAFAVAYALYPITLKLRQLGIRKSLSIFTVLFLFIGIFVLVGTLALPLLFEQLGNLFNGIISFIKDISIKYDLDFGPLQQTLSTSFDDIIKNAGKYISDGAISIISTSLSYLGIFIVSFAAAIYLLIDMDRIRAAIKKHYKKKDKKTFNYIVSLDRAMKGYLDGFSKIVIITSIEYTIAFTLIGHPDAILLGCL
jgi:predicted PurR-regulated permease PerM